MKNMTKLAVGHQSAHSRDGPLIFHLRDGPPKVTGPPGGTGPPPEINDLAGATGPPGTTGPPMEWLVRKKISEDYLDVVVEISSEKQKRKT